ncbi:MAG: hypothetical protein QOF77_2400 [Solirubrobacteraceae bacterium]|jgi:hypothetical protein|nr:hypothetical protein [Solirubrobacteraceae bacterium]
MASDGLPAFRTPHGHEVLERSAVIGRRAFTVDADFGSPAGARRSLSTVNSVLGSLRAHQTPPAGPP